MATQLELPCMNHCPRCEGRWKKCSLCFGTGTIPDQMIELCRSIRTTPLNIAKTIRATIKLNRMRSRPR